MAVKALGLLLLAAAPAAAGSEVGLRTRSTLRPALLQQPHPAAPGSKLLQAVRRVQTAPMTPAAAPAAVVPPAVEAPSAPTVAEDEAEVGLASQMRQQVRQAKQQRANIVSLEEALTADVALLRESGTLQKVATSVRARAAAQAQVRKTEDLVKDVSAMLKSTRAAAVQDARRMLQDSQEVKAVADEMRQEAQEELSLLGSAHPAKPAAAPAKAADAATETADVPVGSSDGADAEDAADDASGADAAAA